MSEHVRKLEETVGRHLRARRIAADLTQGELAARANVSVGAVRGLEAGRGSNLSTLLAVSRVLGVEDWVEQLAPPAPTFSPLDLYEQRRRDAASRPSGHPRVRRARPR